MKTTAILLVCSSLLFTKSFAQTHQSLLNESYEFSRKKEYKKAMERTLMAIEMTPAQSHDFYNLAFFADKLHDQDSVFKYIKLALDSGWKDKVAFLNFDKGLREFPEWAELFGEIEKNYRPDLKKLLLEIKNKDQAIRSKWDSVLNEYGREGKEFQLVTSEMDSIDSQNRYEISRLLDEFGWIGRNVVGEAASEVQFLVIQHSPMTYQVKYFRIIKKAFRSGDLAGSRFALLKDRLWLSKGRKQIYGSQIGHNKQTNELYVHRLRNPKKVDRRRASFGMDPLDQYAYRYGIDWTLKSHKTAMKQLKSIKQKG